MRNVGVQTIGENARKMLDLDKPTLDWVSMTKGMGVEAARARTCEEFTNLLDHALSSRSPFLIEAVI
ncbi:putative acetolactate synthase large subunit IlvX [compost metagenome]